MCGLAGIVLSHQGHPDERTLLAMRDVQRHRGPDEAGIYLGEGVGLGHRRLSIIDLSHGQQPMVDDKASLALIYNGELYNFMALRAELEALGTVFVSHSDTEVLLRAWQHWGEACLPRLVGIFAFAVWDKSTQRIFLARDQIGVKPLYYGFTTAGDLVFASELKGLLAHPDVERKLDPQALEDYLAFGYVPDPKSIYQGIFKLPPGHWLSWRAGEPAPAARQYWDVPFKLDSQLGESEAAAKLRTLLDDAVASQMVADVPLGAFLSGGVDSSAVVASMSRIAPEPVNTCSIGFDHSGFDETAYARQVAEHLHTKHFEERVSSQDDDLLDMLAGIYDEPFADSSALPTWRVCQLARKHVTVALSCARVCRWRCASRCLDYWEKSTPRPIGRRARCAPRPPCRHSLATTWRPISTVSALPRRRCASSFTARASNANFRVTARSRCFAPTRNTRPPTSRCCWRNTWTSRPGFPVTS
jgi:asparagine synthase (glutamine-hydrolysing)